MLIEFKVGNFRSIREAQTFSMVASAQKELLQNVNILEMGVDFPLLSSAVIYGPNAAGKSNLIKALAFMRNFIVNSAKESQYSEKIPVKSFLFDEESRDKPTTFEITFSHERVRYQYSFELDQNQVMEEILLAYPSGKAQQWFARRYNKKTKKYDFSFSKLFLGDKKKIAELTRPNVLFLSNAVALNNEQLRPVWAWFQEGLLLLPASREFPLHKSITYLETPKRKNEVIRYLNVADPTILDILLDVKEFSEDDLPIDAPQELKDIIKKDLTGKRGVKINFFHKGDASLTFDEESDGTKKFLGLSGYWIDALEEGKIVIVDELDSSLHSLAVKFLISLFADPKINKKHAQLIFTTHDTSLLNDDEIFRRDQVWFVEKDKTHATQLYPLLEFSPRKNEAIGKGYLQGRYGALPYIGHWRF